MRSVYGDDDSSISRQRRLARVGHFQDDVQIADGVCEGIIAFGPVGNNGFGYDPVFYLPDRGLTMAQLRAEDKNETSHRGRAARAAEKLLEAMLQG